MYISKYFSMEEVEHSNLAERLDIDNRSPDTVQASVTYTAKQMDNVREALGKSILVDSWYRCLALNRALKSKDTSQHRNGEAVDFISPAYGTPYDIVSFLAERREKFQFDQIIYEHTWVHISFIIPPRKPRLEVLTLMPDGSYANGLFHR